VTAEPEYRCEVCGVRIARPGWCARCHDDIARDYDEWTRR
jgi:hypothetical protein